MNKEDKKLQKHLVNEMMKVSKTNPDVMIYMQALMESYEKLEQKVDRLNNIIKKLIYECWESDMSYGGFEGVWQIAFDEKYEPDKIKKIEEELKEGNNKN